MLLRINANHVSFANHVALLHEARKFNNLDNSINNLEPDQKKLKQLLNSSIEKLKTATSEADEFELSLWRRGMG